MAAFGAPALTIHPPATPHSAILSKTSTCLLFCSCCSYHARVVNVCCRDSSPLTSLATFLPPATLPASQTSLSVARAAARLLLRDGRGRAGRGRTGILCSVALKLRHWLHFTYTRSAYGLGLPLRGRMGISATGRGRHCRRACLHWTRPLLFHAACLQHPPLPFYTNWTLGDDEDPSVYAGCALYWSPPTAGNHTACITCRTHILNTTKHNA